MVRFYTSLKNVHNIISKNQSKNPFIIILTYFFILFLIDYSGIMDLYGQNMIRRLLNMFRRRDELTYQSRLNPFCKSVKKVLNTEDVKKLQSIQIPEKYDMGWFTRYNTTTHQCCKNFSKAEQQIIQEISDKVKKAYEEQIGKKLYYLGDNKATIYVYHGQNSQHLWHVDPQNLPEIYNIIVCFRKKGGISPLQCKNSEGKADSIFFEEGDAAIFNGGTTVHQVPPNEDVNSERTVLSIAFTSDNSMNDPEKIEKRSNNLCTWIEGGNNTINLIKIVLSIFVLNLIIGYISGVEKIPYTFLIPFFILCLVIVKYIPLYFDIGLGSKRSSSILFNMFALFLTVVCTLSIKGGTVFFLYFILSDVFFPRSWVFYD